jgi:putative membrane protein
MTLGDRVVLFLKGMAIGIADSVPGVSGGTIAVISGIYERLLSALRSCNPKALKILYQQGLKAFWRSIDGSFLLTLGLGILTSLMLMANTVLYLLDNHFMLVMAFFMGLVLASCLLLYREMGSFSVIKAILFMLGFVLTVLTAVINPAAGSTSLLYLFLCGAIAICAMILPGISGAFILILLGVYQYVLDALRSFQLDIVLVFALGCLIGLLSFAHVLTWMFFYYRQPTYAFLVGMLAASIVVLWPWRLSTEPGGGLGMMPWVYTHVTGNPAQLPAIVLCAAVGFVVIMAFAATVARLSRDK